jgi:hypothetical protein
MNYTWTITSLIAFPILEGKSNVISTIFFDVSTEENGTRYAKTGSINLPTDSIENFIPYDTLKPEILIEWVKHHIGSEGVESIELDVANQLGLQINSPQVPVSVSLPW